MHELRPGGKWKTKWGHKWEKSRGEVGVYRVGGHHIWGAVFVNILVNYDSGRPTIWSMEGHQLWGGMAQFKSLILSIGAPPMTSARLDMSHASSFPHFMLPPASQVHIWTSVSRILQTSYPRSGVSSRSNLWSCF